MVREMEAGRGRPTEKGPRRPVPGEVSEESDLESVASVRLQVPHGRPSRARRALRPGDSPSPSPSPPLSPARRSFQIPGPMVRSSSPSNSPLALRRSVSERPRSSVTRAASISEAGEDSGKSPPRQRTASPRRSRTEQGTVFARLYNSHRDRLNRLRADQAADHLREEVRPPAPGSPTVAAATCDRLFREEPRKREERRIARNAQRQEELARETPFTPTLLQGSGRGYDSQPGQRHQELYELRSELEARRQELRERKVQEEQAYLAANSVHRCKSPREAEEVSRRLHEEAELKKQRRLKQQLEKEKLLKQKTAAERVPHVVAKTREDEDKIFQRLFKPVKRLRQQELRQDELQWLEERKRFSLPVSNGKPISPKQRPPKQARQVNGFRNVSAEAGEHQVNGSEHVSAEAGEHQVNGSEHVSAEAGELQVNGSEHVSAEAGEHQVNGSEHVSAEAGEHQVSEEKLPADEVPLPKGGSNAVELLPLDLEDTW
eukprot:TRINITY_DN16614_c0_g1_i2.p1 TRINITY_DN16614_c0_g1~~TRINITY_DN16614_c0_g1_i2.p1  ORF type:complete len:490 (+),score=81.81 TRINITY_DN16614_c0_g1_i2:73-1542(+)